MQPRARSARKRFTRRSSSEWKEIAASRPPVAQQVPGQRQRAVERVELVVHGDPDRLEDALGRVPAAEAAPHGGRQRGLDRRDQLAGRLDRRARRAGARSRARSGARSAPRRSAGRAARAGARPTRSRPRARRAPGSGPCACRAARRRSRRSRARARRPASRRCRGPGRPGRPRRPPRRAGARPVGVVHAQEARLAGHLARRARRSAPRRPGRGRCRRACRSGPIRSATRRAWPPAPKVQSTAISPGRGRGEVDQLAGQDGYVRAVMSRRMAKALRHLLDLRVEGLLLRPASGPRPDLEVVPHADHDDLLLDPRVRRAAAAAASRGRPRRARSRTSCPGRSA